MDDPTYRVYICCGINCGPKGSRQLVDFLEEELERLALQDRVAVYPGGCQNHCDSGPTMVVYPGPVFYQEVDRRRIRHIATEHLANDRPVAAYFWSGVARAAFARKPFRLDPSPFPRLGTGSSVDKSPRPAPKKKSYEDVDDFKW